MRRYEGARVRPTVRGCDRPTGGVTLIRTGSPTLAPRTPVLSDAPPHPRTVARRTSPLEDDGVALIAALMAMTLMLALGTALMMVTTTETRIAENHRDGIETFYAAEAAIDVAMSSLRTVPRWTDVLTGATTSPFIDGPPGGIRKLGGGAVIDLTRDSPKDVSKVPWRLYVYGPLGDLVGVRTVGMPIYVAVWVAGDPDMESLLTLWATACGPGGARRTVEATIERIAADDPDTEESRIQRLFWRER